MKNGCPTSRLLLREVGFSRQLILLHRIFFHAVVFLHIVFFHAVVFLHRIFLRRLGFLAGLLRVVLAHRIVLYGSSFFIESCWELSCFMESCPLDCAKAATEAVKMQASAKPPRVFFINFLLVVEWIVRQVSPAGRKWDECKRRKLQRY
jgi:hypothetical protein